MTRSRRTLRRWNDDFGTPRGGGSVNRKRVIGCVRGETLNVTQHVVDYRKPHLRIVEIPIGQNLSDDHARSINAEMKLLPSTPTAPAILGGSPLSFANDGEPRAVDDEMDGSIDCDPMEIDIETLAATGERGVVWCIEVDSHQKWTDRRNPSA